jgi:GTP-binding protein EngB required for normal cell division
MNTNSIPIDNINICFVGGVSTGKSTVLNSIFCEKLTQCKIKRTTMVPTIYVENAKGQTEPSEIYRIIEEKNKEIIEATELGQKLETNAYSELAFNVGKLDINILGDTGAFVNVYDVPGLNDARTQDIYYNYLETNFHKFNLIVFLVDIHSGLNTADEMRMLKFIVTNTKHHIKCSHSRNIHTLVIVNKADDMQDHDSKMEITGELSEMFAQTENTVRHEFGDLEHNLIGVIPLCAIDAYLYRMIKKHGTAFELSPEHVLKIGVNENGKKFSTKKPEVQRAEVAEILKNTDFIDTMIKLSGFKGFTDAMHQFLNANDKGRQIRMDNLQYEMDKLDPISDMKIDKLQTLVAKYIILFDKMEAIDPTSAKKRIQYFVTDLTRMLNFRIECWSDGEDALVQFYDNYILQIFVPRFAEYYDTTKYSETLKHHVITMVCEACGNSLSVQTIIDKLMILKRIALFDKNTLNTLFAIIVANVREKETVDFSELTNSQMQKLISLFDKCRTIDVNLSQMLRFLIINQLYSESFAHDFLYMKYLLYVQSGELIISNYMQSAYSIKPSLATFVQGLPKEMVLTRLDQYYVHYERTMGFWNFAM